MTTDELKKLTRVEMLELLIDQAKETESLKDQIAQLEEKLAEKNAMMQDSSTVAEASFRLNGTVKAAQAAADQYVENVYELSRNQEEVCREKELRAQRQAESILAAARAQAEYIAADAEDYGNPSIRMEEFCETHPGMKEILNLCV